MAGPQTYSLHVGAVEHRSPSQTRVVLEGEDLHRFPADFEGGYVKLLFPKPGVDPAEATPAQCTRRSMTVRAFDRGALTLDIARHDPGGPAMKWLNEAGVGTPIRIAGPGPVKRLNPKADAVVLVGDLAALPALAVNLEKLPDTAEGHAYIEVPLSEDRQSLFHPPGVRLHWLTSNRENFEQPLVTAVEQMNWPEGTVSVWSATEFSVMKSLRTIFRDRGVQRENLYLSSYWKRDATDEEHKAAKATDAG
ncbi:MAG: siderophore-interacting protein [Myxococcota bacterium]